MEGRQKVEEMSARWKPDAILIENAGSGAKIIGDLQTTDIPSDTTITYPFGQGGKCKRCFSALERGWVRFPKYAEWPDRYIQSLIGCQLGQHDSRI